MNLGCIFILAVKAKNTWVGGAIQQHFNKNLHASAVGPGSPWVSLPRFLRASVQVGAAAILLHNIQNNLQDYAASYPSDGADHDRR
jgi:hypothetical protein